MVVEAAAAPGELWLPARGEGASSDIATVEGGHCTEAKQASKAERSLTSRRQVHTLERDGAASSDDEAHEQGRQPGGGQGGEEMGGTRHQWSTKGVLRLVHSLARSAFARQGQVFTRRLNGMAQANRAWQVVTSGVRIDSAVCGLWYDVW